MLTPETLAALGITKPLPRLGRPPSRPNPRPPPAPDTDGRRPVEMYRRLATDADIDKHRSLRCAFYTRCLDDASRWESWSCSQCQHHGKSTTDAELVTLASRRSGSVTP